MLTVKQSPSGPDYVNDASVALDHGAITSKEVLEATVAVTNLAQNDGLVASPPTELFGAAGVFLSHARFSAAGTMSVGLANLNGVGQNPANTTYRTLRYFRNARVSPDGKEIGSAKTVTLASPGNVGALTAAALDIVANPLGFAMWASPRSALPAGFAFSHAAPFGGFERIVIANLTGGALDPGETVWDVFGMFGPNAVGSPVRSAPSGRHLVRRINNVSLDHGSIGAAAVLEASINVETDVRIGDVVVVQPRAALPTGIAVSHGRVSATGVVQIGLANLTGGAIDPASQDYDLTVLATGAKAA